MLRFFLFLSLVLATNAEDTVIEDGTTSTQWPETPTTTLLRSPSTTIAFCAAKCYIRAAADPTMENKFGPKAWNSVEDVKARCEVLKTLRTCLGECGELTTNLKELSDHALEGFGYVCTIEDDVMKTHMTCLNKVKPETVRMFDTTCNGTERIASVMKVVMEITETIMTTTEDKFEPHLKRLATTTGEFCSVFTCFAPIEKEMLDRECTIEGGTGAFMMNYIRNLLQPFKFMMTMLPKGETTGDDVRCNLII